VCACPLGEPMDLMPLSVKYRHGDRCRKRAYRAKLKGAAEAVGLQVAPTLRAVELMVSTRERDGHAENGRKRAQKRAPELRVSYPKAVEAMTERLVALIPPGVDLMDELSSERCREIAEEGLSTALSTRQREVLEQRERAAA